MSKKLIVYYNSACPVCEAGICYQRTQMADQEIDWVDVHTQQAVFQQTGLDLESVREQLHVLDQQGRLLIGDQALASLWRKTPQQRSFAWIVDHAPWLTRPLYTLFAKCLYRWNRLRGNW